MKNEMPHYLQNNRIKALSRFVAWVLCGAIICFAVWYVLTLINITNGKITAVDLHSGNSAPPKSLKSWIIFILFYGAIIGSKIAVLFNVAMLFFGFSRGDIFTKTSIQRIKWIGYTLVLYAVISFAGVKALLALFAGAYPALNLDDYWRPMPTVALGLIVWVIALAFEAGRKIQEEISLTV